MPTTSAAFQANSFFILPSSTFFPWVEALSSSWTDKDKEPGPSQSLVYAALTRGTDLDAMCLTPESNALESFKFFHITDNMSHPFKDQFVHLLCFLWWNLHWWKYGLLKYKRKTAKYFTKSIDVHWLHGKLDRGIIAAHLTRKCILREFYLNQVQVYYSLSNQKTEPDIFMKLNQKIFCQLKLH